MNDQLEEDISPLVLVSYFVGLPLVFFIPASIYMLLLASTYQPLYFIILFPMIGIVSLITYYLRVKIPLESPNRLILLDIIIFLLYFICIFLIFYTLLDPQTNFLFYDIVLWGLRSVYFVLLIPLIGIIVLTYFIIKINRPVRKKKLAVILVFLGVVITVFIIIFYLLEWSFPILQEIYSSLPDLD